jgi:UDP-N-acetylmuramate--alanine ligase
MFEKNKNINTIKTIYFIGIGGIGMSAIARYFYAKGKKVSGYDRAPSDLTRTLEQSGIPVHYQEDTDRIPKDADLVVYTPAIPEDHRELMFYRQHEYQLIKRSEMLGWITSQSFNICIAGTHGKTTTTTMTAHLLKDSGYGCNAFLGGISANYNTNYWADDRNLFVVEADEYDRSFLKLDPDIAVITAMDADHLDIYGTAENVHQAYLEFASRIKPGGLLIKKFGLDNKLGGGQSMTYSLQNESADAHAVNILIKDGAYLFDASVNGELIGGLQLRMGGMHNVENMIAAISVAVHLGIDNEKIGAAVASFKGVKRRFEYILNSDALTYIDDYAHHPEELKALIQGEQTLFRQRRTTLIFQPHLYSRTRDFADAFAEVLDMVDRVILLPVYPARELPIEGVDSSLIADKMKRAARWLMNPDQLLDWVRHEFVPNLNTEFGEVIITAGAGNIDRLVPQLKSILEN